ncbi:MAG: hypothetical protein ABSF47_01015 [Minisyncoccia bacterium]|jgi:UDP-N-acetyl-D-mannosaminuronic acid transferase (WecB/TagA/CpsF family)
MAQRIRNTEEKKNAEIIRAANKARKSFFANQEKTVITKLKKDGASEEVIQKMKIFIAQGMTITGDGW